jgi:DNA-binding transcriptional MerR regulator
MSKRVTVKMLNEIIRLRQNGCTISEIKNKLKLGQGTVYRYTRQVNIMPEFLPAWLAKKSTSIHRKQRDLAVANEKAKKDIKMLSKKEKVLILSSLYWAEGSKSDFGLSNTDPSLIKVFILCLKDILQVQTDDLRVSIRIYEDLNKDKCLSYWSAITGVSKDDFVSVNVLKGKKAGKLSYGMCRVRVKKGGNLLKYILAIKDQIVALST